MMRSCEKPQDTRTYLCKSVFICGLPGSVNNVKHEIHEHWNKKGMKPVMQNAYLEKTESALDFLNHPEV